MKKILLLLVCGLVGWGVVADEICKTYNDKDNDCSSRLDVKVEYVSKTFNGSGALEDDHNASLAVIGSDNTFNDSAIYRVTISGVPLGRDELFSYGVNGFRYEIRVVGRGDEYLANAYPLFGAEYKEEGDIRKKWDHHNISLLPKTISFYWKGPSASISNWKIKIQQRAYDFLHNTNWGIYETEEIKLPDPVKEPVDLKSYTISFEKSQVTTYRNGVCATPFNVYIKDRSNNEAPKEVYEHLFFYKRPSKGSDQPEIIGGDPNGNSCKLAIIPAEDANLTGEPIYHTDGKYTDLKGKLFYVFSGYKETKDNDTNVITAVLVDDSRNIVNSQNLEVTSRCSDATVVWGKGQNMSLFYREVYFSDNSEISVPKDGNLNYVFTNIEKLSYIIPLLPEGVNERPLSARYNFSKFNSGYYLISSQTGGKVTRLSVTDRTAILYDTFNKDIYAYIFDIYGRHNEGSLYHDNKMVYTGEGELNWKSKEECELTSERNLDRKQRMLIIVFNSLPYPVKFRLKNYVNNDKPEVPDSYLILAPNRMVRMATHLSKKDINLESKIKVYRLTGPYSQIMDEINDEIDTSIMAEIGTSTRNEIIIKGRCYDNNKGFFINQKSETSIVQKAVNSITYHIVFLEDAQNNINYYYDSNSEFLSWYNFDAMWYLDNGKKLKYEHNNEQD